MLLTYKNGQASIVLRVKLLDSSSTTGAGLTGLSSASAGLIVSTIADNEATATTYTVAGTTIESITTLGTYAAPTATKCRFKEVDSTNHKGVYEFQFADARFAVSSAKSLLVSVLGATNLQQADFVVQLQSDDPFVAKPTNSSLLSIDGSGRVDVAKIAGTSQTARDIGASVLLSAGSGAGQLDFTSGVVKANATQWLGGTIPAVNVTGVPLVDLKYTLGTISPAAAGSVRADAVTGAVGSVTGAVGSVTGAVGSVTGNVGGNVVGSVASVTAAVAITSNIKKNQALAAFEFMMTDSTNHAPATGKTVTCTRSIDGGAFAAGTLANVTEISNGIYSVDFGAGDLNGKVITLRATAASSDDTFERIVSQA